jgi:hypothetical protein
VPAGIDLSGNWLIRNDQRESQRRLNAAIRKTDGVDEREIFGQPSSRSSQNRPRSSKGVKGGLVDLFLETGTALKITQTPYALFISFDRSIVEEFRFGELRMISVGEVQAQRATGWEGSQLVVDTLDRNSMKLTDRFQLLEDGQVLERTITLRSEQGETESVVQLFDRVN